MQDLIDREGAVAAIEMHYRPIPTSDFDTGANGGMRIAVEILRSLPSASALPGGVSAEDVMVARYHLWAAVFASIGKAAPYGSDAVDAAARRILAAMEGR